MLYQVIVKTPSNADVLAVDEDKNFIEGNGVIARLASMRAEWRDHACADGGSIMPGTAVVASEKLNHVILDIESEDPLTFLQGQLLLEGKPWTIVAMDYHLPSDKSGLPADLPITTAEIEPFLEPVTDTNGVYHRPTLPVTMHSFDGKVVFEVPAQ